MWWLKLNIENVYCIIFPKSFPDLNSQYAADILLFYFENQWKQSIFYPCCWFKWVSDCCLMPNELYFSYIMARTGWWDDNDIHFNMLIIFL
jgi:hypothetical protein